MQFKKTTMCEWLVIVLAINNFCITFGHDAKDFDDTIQYKIDFEMPDLVKNPELQNQLQSFYTNEKEKYDCVIPIVEDSKEENKINEQEMGPFVLLQPLFTAASCSYRIEAYWSYEICHGHYVRQYHEEREGKTVKFQEYYLGQITKEDMLQKKVDTWKEKEKVGGVKYKTTKIENTKYPYFEVEMSGGTMCDIINAPRTTLVRYVCYPHSKNEIYSFKETSSCTYEAIILTSVLCMIPAFQAEESKEVSIKCFNSPTEPHKPLSMLRQELNDMQMSVDFPVSKEANEAAAALAQSASGGEQFIFLNKFGSDVDKLVMELMAAGAETGTAAAQQQLDTISASSEMLKSSSTPPLTAMTPIKDFISGKNCLTGGNGWWKYEFCYGRHVRQFHKDKKSETELFLGYFTETSHKQWVNENPTKGAKRAGYSASLWHHYVKGSQCDRTGLPREVDVKLTCTMSSTSSTAVSMYLLEPKTCQYILVVESPVVCALITLADEYGLVEEGKLQELLLKDDSNEDNSKKLSPAGSAGSVSINAADVQV